jgi:hypothetical protein
MDNPIRECQPMKARQWMVLAITFSLFSLSVHSVTAANNATQAAQSAFKKEFKLNSSETLKTLNYDADNDGKQDIVLMNQNGSIYLGVYNSQNGVKIAASKVLNASDEYDQQDVSLKMLKNPTYKNSIAILANGYAGANMAWVDVHIYALQGGKLKKIGSTSSDGESINFTDKNKDGYQEVVGSVKYNELESEDLYNKVYDTVVFQWDSKKKQYIKIVYGQDGKRDDQRKDVGPVTVQQALTVLSKGYSLQQSFSKASDQKSYLIRMAPLFTFNYINGFITTLMEDSGRYLPEYMMSDDYSSLMPEFDPKQSAILKLSSDKKLATITQTIKVTSEEGTSTVKAQAVLYKTKYGWKVNSADYID